MSSFDEILLYINNYPQNKLIKTYARHCMPMCQMPSILLIPVNRFQSCSYWESSLGPLLNESPWTWLRSRPEKLPRIVEVNMLNLGLRKTKQETTAPQIISFHWTPQCEKHKHRTPKGLRSPQHRKLRFYSPYHRSKNIINTATPHVPLLVEWLVGLAFSYRSLPNGQGLQTELCYQ